MATPLSSVGGLVSGLDTASIINQLMQVEAQGQTRLKTQLTTEQSTLTSLQDLNSTFASLATNAADLAKATAWNPMTVSSTDTNVTATAGTGAITGPLTLTVNSTATATQLSFTTTAALTDPVTNGPTTVNLTVNGTTTTLDTGDGTLNGLINALNTSGTGVKASTVKQDDGSYRLLVTSATTGAASNFTLTNTDGSAILGGATVSAGQDASITIGPDTLHSATNTFTDIANGLTITLGAGATAGSSVTLDAQQDVDSMTAKVKSFVDAINGALDKLDKLTSYDSTTKTSGPLAGDSGIRQLRDNLLNAVYPTDGTSMADAGVELDRYGRLTFDEATFKTAYAADPTGTAAKFTSGTVAGFADRIDTVASRASDSVDGTITTVINGTNSEISDLQDQIAKWDVRLGVRRDSLQRQFASLETALSQMNSQSNWLSSQLGSLSSGSA